MKTREIFIVLKCLSSVEICDTESDDNMKINLKQLTKYIRKTEVLTKYVQYEHIITLNYLIRVSFPIIWACVLIKSRHTLRRFIN